jgi:hypothetical protein
MRDIYQGRISFHDNDMPTARAGRTDERTGFAVAASTLTQSTAVSDTQGSVVQPQSAGDTCACHLRTVAASCAVPEAAQQ